MGALIERRIDTTLEEDSLGGTFMPGGRGVWDWEVRIDGRAMQGRAKSKGAAVEAMMREIEQAVRGAR